MKVVRIVGIEGGDGKGLGMEVKVGRGVLRD